MNAKLLRSLLDYHRFAPNGRLTALLGETQARLEALDAEKLPEADLKSVCAAGDPASRKKNSKEGNRADDKS